MLSLATALILKIVKIVVALILWTMIIYWLLSSATETSRFKTHFKKYYQKKVAKINNEFGKGTWKKFTKNDLKDTQQVVKKTLSKKTITSDEYYKLRELVDEMERYIENNIECSPTTELDDELEVLRKINTQKSLSKIKERIKWFN